MTEAAELLAAPLSCLEDYADLESDLARLRETDPESWRANVALQAQADLYFLLRCVLSSGSTHNRFKNGMRFIEHPFSYRLARAMQADYDGVMTMAGRGHGKSITGDFGLNLWLYINNPMISICIWSVTRALAKSHLQVIRDEITSNKLLFELWPEFFYPKNPKSCGAASWSLDDGLSMPLCPPHRNEKTFEAWGLTDQAFPTGKHFDHMCFDDVVDERCVTSPEMITAARQTHDQAGGVEQEGCTRTYLGTPYADGDTGVKLVEEGEVRLRAIPAVDPDVQDTPTRVRLGGRPVFLSEEEMLKKLGRMQQNYWSQMCLDPNRGRKGTLDSDRIRYYSRPPSEERARKNVYLCVDPNGGFAKTVNDPMALTVWGLGGDKNFYLLDAFLGHLDPGERHALIISKQAQWDPIEVRIEEMTSGTDSFWLNAEMERRGHRFEVCSIRVETMRKGSGKMGEFTRVMRLTEAWEPLLEQHRLYIPQELKVECRDDDGAPVIRDLAAAFVDEIRRFPIAKSDNLISSGALLFADHGGKRGANPLIWPAAYVNYHPIPGYERLWQPPPGRRDWMLIS